MTCPPVSVAVLTPTFNSGRFLVQAVESCLRVDPGIADVTVVVADGGSSDETRDVLEAVTDERLRWLSEPDRGQSDALNRAFHRSSGDWVGWLNADERYAEGTFTRLAEHISRHPEADVIYGDVLFQELGTGKLSLHAKHGFSSFVLKHYGCFIQTSSTFIRRDALEKVALSEGPWDVGHRRIMDWDLYLRLAQTGAHFSYCPSLVSTFLTHPDQVTSDVAARDHPDHLRLRADQSLPLSGIRRTVLGHLGHLAHFALKLAARSYARERRFRALNRD